MQSQEGGGPGVKTSPSTAGDKDSNPGQAAKTPHATEQLNPHAATTQPNKYFLKEPCNKFFKIFKERQREIWLKKRPRDNLSREDPSPARGRASPRFAMSG